MPGRDWRPLILELVLIKQQMREVDRAGLWDYRLPRVAANEADLVAVERKIGEPLDSSFRSFLSYAAGWLAFYQTVDLFGPAELLGGSRFEQASKVLESVEEPAIWETGFRREELLPIANSSVDLDLFVMTRTHSASPGIVIWLAGSEVDRFASFDDYFAAMVEYNRLELKALSDGGGG